ncbi:MAG: sodium/proline symporter, partial [Alphaproteobacteria bacterium]|nr:sodium/proline symporter [Alphaproteobacteria bacterium]
MIYSFAFFLLLFVLVGLASYRYSQPTTQDYLLAGRTIKPGLAGLSLFATESSGFMFIGYIGITYIMGLSVIWIALGWYLGTSSIMWSMGRRLRHRNETVQADTYGALLSRWTGEDYKIIRVLSALITIVFLSVYAAAQLSAGGKALQAMMGIDIKISALISVSMVLAYCLAGGIRASIWTDAVQSLAMFIALVLIVAYGLNMVGGFEHLMLKLKEIDPNLTEVFAGAHKYGFLGFFAGWIFGGMGVLGQPHVMVRFMVLEKAQSAKKAVLYYALMVSALAVLCTIAGLCARVVLPDLINGDPELAL